MDLKIGAKIRGREIVFVSEDKRVWATYMPDSLGAKGKIWGQMLIQDPTDEERKEYWDHAIQIIQVGGVWYKELEFVDDYPHIFSRCNWYTTNRASAYSK